MRGLTIFSKLYDKMLYAYLYMWIYIDQMTDKYADFRANAKWIRENGPHRG